LSKERCSRVPSVTEAGPVERAAIGDSRAQGVTGGVEALGREPRQARMQRSRAADGGGGGGEAQGGEAQVAGRQGGLLVRGAAGQRVPRASEVDGVVAEEMGWCKLLDWDWELAPGTATGSGNRGRVRLSTTGLFSQRPFCLERVTDCLYRDNTCRRWAMGDGWQTERRSESRQPRSKCRCSCADTRQTGLFGAV
jgi:hypothetical protein